MIALNHVLNKNMDKEFNIKRMYNSKSLLRIILI